MNKKLFALLIFLSLWLVSGIEIYYAEQYYRRKDTLWNKVKTETLEDFLIFAKKQDKEKSKGEKEESFREVNEFWGRKFKNREEQLKALFESPAWLGEVERVNKKYGDRKVERVGAEIWVYEKEIIRYSFEEIATETVVRGFINAMLSGGLGLLGMVFLYNVCLVCLGIVGIKRRLNVTIWDGIIIGSIIAFVVVLISAIGKA